MKDFPSCFGENGVQIADASCTSSAPSMTVSKAKASQNLVTCVYQCKLLGKSRFIIINWSKNLVGHCFSVEIEDLSHNSLCKLDVKLSFFSKRKGSKCFHLNSAIIDLYWDLTFAKFASSPEPIEGFYLGLVCNGEMVVLIGDLKKELFKKANATESLFSFLHITKREHIFGKEFYATKAQFSDNGKIHDLRIECDTFGVNDPCLVVRLDQKLVMQVKHLVWKFRGNFTICVDGVPVEVYWDVHNWLFGSPFGSAVFMFHTFFDPSMVSWESKLSDPGFTLILYAWKND